MNRKTIDVTQSDDGPGSLEYILNEHDRLYDEQRLLKRKNTKEWLHLQDQIIALRQEYNDKVGREMFKID